MDEANKKYTETKAADIGTRVNVMDIEVNDNLDIDDI